MNAQETLKSQVAARLTLLHMFERALHDESAEWTVQVFADSGTSQVYPVCKHLPDDEPVLYFTAHDVPAVGPCSLALQADGETMLSTRADLLNDGEDLMMVYALEGVLQG